MILLKWCRNCLNVLLHIVTELNFSIRRSHSPAYVEYMFRFDIRQKEWSWFFASFALDNTSLPVFINTSKLTLFFTCISFKLRSTFDHVICVREQPKNFGRYVFNASKKLRSCGTIAEEDAVEPLAIDWVRKWRTTTTEVVRLFLF
jgi:hypothetical protein